MTHAPAMMLWTDAYLADTSHLTTMEHGTYLLILMAMWRAGGELPADETRIARITKLPLHTWRKIAPTIMEFMELDQERAVFTQKRLHHTGPGIEKRAVGSQWKMLREITFKRDNFICRYCGTDGAPLECDHIIPVSRGGTNKPSNLATACMPCNRAKGKKTAEEWLHD